MIILTLTRWAIPFQVEISARFRELQIIRKEQVRAQEIRHRTLLTSDGEPGGNFRRIFRFPRQISEFGNFT